MSPYRAVLLLGLAGCSASSANLAQVHERIEAAGALATTARLALGSITSATDVTLCAAASARCTGSFPCDGAATITLGDDCPLPFDTGVRGTVKLTGTFTSADHATLTSTFVDVRTGTVPVAVVSATQLTIDRSASSATVSYVGQDVQTSHGVLAQQSSWTVVVDDAGTADPGDDRFTVDGTDQSSGVGVDQIDVTGAVLDPTCRDNPVAGSASLQHVSLGSIEQDAITFHAACDGRADVRAATGGTHGSAF